MRISEIDCEKVSDEAVERVLFGGLDYHGESADLIMVLGSKKACIRRVPTAVEIYLEKKAPHILFCGGKVQHTPFGFMPEFQSMLLQAKILGVDEDRILTEQRSLTTAENFEFSKKIIEDNVLKCKKIILVTAGFHMRRAALLARKIMPQYEFIPCSCQTGSSAEDVWRFSEKGKNTAMLEIKRLKTYAQKGFIEDIEI